MEQYSTIPVPVEIATSPAPKRLNCSVAMTFQKWPAKRMIGQVQHHFPPVGSSPCFADLSSTAAEREVFERAHAKPLPMTERTSAVLGRSIGSS